MNPPDWPHSLSFFRSALGRLLAAGALVLLGYFLLMALLMNSFSERLMATHREQLQRVVDLGLNELEQLRDEDLIEPTYSVEQLRREGAIRIRELTYRYRLGENYLFMVTTDGLVLVHPFETDLEFTNQLDLQDANGRYFIREMIEAAGSGNGSGFVEYSYPPPGRDEPLPKLSYVVGIPEWEAILGSGMYLESINQENRRHWLVSSLMAAGLLLAITLLVMLTIEPLARSYRVLQDLFSQIRSDPSIHPPVPKERFREGSESWRLLADFELMLDRIEETKQAREEAALNERSRLARELHDAVSQTLFSASIIADSLPDLFNARRELAFERLGDLSDLIRGALAEMRTLLLELRPAAITEADLSVLLKQLAEAVAGRHRIPVGLEAVETKLAPDAQLAFYRIAQEALNNAAKHSQAGRIDVQLGRANGEVVMTITDDGCGFELSESAQGRMGLAIMRERAAAVGGKLFIESQSGCGTSVRLRWTVPAAAMAPVA